MKIWILLFLIMAAIYDYRDFKIPNKLNGAGALITLVLAGVSGMKAADMMIGVLVVLISCGLLFYIGCLGGGDVKLLMVCAISIGRAMPRFLILSFICNGIYAVIFLWVWLSLPIKSTLCVINGSKQSPSIRTAVSPAACVKLPALGSLLLSLIQIRQSSRLFFGPAQPCPAAANRQRPFQKRFPARNAFSKPLCSACYQRPVFSPPEPELIDGLLRFGDAKSDEIPFFGV